MDLVNTIETTLLHVSLSNFADMLTMMTDEKMNPIDFGGQRSNVKVTMDVYGNKLVNTIETKLVYFLIKLGRHVSYGGRMNPIDFGGQR